MNKNITRPVTLLSVALGGGYEGFGVFCLLTFFLGNHNIWRLLLGLFLFVVAMCILIFRSRFQQRPFWKYGLWLALIILIAIFLGFMWNIVNGDIWI